MLTAIVVFLYAFDLVFDFLPSKKAWNRREITVYLAALVLGFCVLILFTLDVEIPSPYQPIVNIVKAIFPGAG